MKRSLALAWLSLALACGASLLTVSCGPSTPSMSLPESARTGKLEFVQRHIKLGADVNKTDSQGWTPLHLAARQGHAAVVEALIAAGADIRALGPQKKSAWLLATENRHKSIADMIQAASVAPAPQTGKGGGRGLIDGGLGVSEAMNSF